MEEKEDKIRDNTLHSLVPNAATFYNLSIINRVNKIKRNRKKQSVKRRVMQYVDNEGM